MQPTSVLTVSADPTWLTELRDILTVMGHRTSLAGDSDEATSLFVPGRFGVILTEVDLPGGDGLELVRRLKEHDPLLVPLVMLREIDADVLVRALECGVRGLLLRPFAAEEVKERLEQAEAERQQAAEARLLMGDLLRLRLDLSEKVQEQQHFLTHLIDATPFAIYSTDRNGRVLTFSRMAERIYGYTAREVVGQAVARLWEAPIRPGANGPDGVAKGSHRRRGGETFPVLVHQREVLGDRSQEIARLYVVEDLSERERMEEQLLYAEKLSLLGQLAPCIAHELKAPLQLISGHTELTLQWLLEDKPEEAKTSAKAILPATQKVLILLRQMTNLGKPGESRQVAVDLGVELDNTLAPLQSLGAVKHCRILRHLDAGLPLVIGDPAQLEQAFRNLIVNAAQAMEGRHTRILTVSARAPVRGRVEVVVEDTGSGIAAEDLERIFQPFYTTKPEGTGLGLPIVRTVLDRHGASLDVRSEPGIGTRFILSFPASPAST